jgi:hypothetical protein
MTSSSRSKRVKQAVKTWLSMAHLVLKLYDSHEHIQRVEWRQENYQDRLPYQKHATRAEAHMKEAKSVTEKWMTCGPTPSPVTHTSSVGGSSYASCITAECRGSRSAMKCSKLRL